MRQPKSGGDNARRSDPAGIASHLDRESFTLRPQSRISVNSCHRWNRNMIRAVIAAAVITVVATSAASAQHRAGDAALGAVSGAVVLGPIGAVAGAFIGYSAGPSIARSWGIDRSRASRQRRQASNESVRGARAEAAPPGNEANPRVASSRNEGAAPAAGPAPSAKAPPVQTLE
jgi:hypothetical protein